MDLFDTVIFVIRKKYIQITFLHVYHHAFMVFITWFALKFDPSDHWGFMAFMNSFVHSIMYIYYGISTMGPDFSQLLWWKKYLTMFQLVSLHIFIDLDNSSSGPNETNKFNNYLTTHSEHGRIPISGAWPQITICNHVRTHMYTPTSVPILWLIV